VTTAGADDRPDGGPAGTARPGRPLRADARRNREQVLRAADELFATEGLSVALDEIARRAGVGPGTVHRHFPAKEALFAAVAAGRLERIVEHARTLADAADPCDAFLAMLTRMLDEGTASTPLKAALAGTDLDLRTAAPAIASELRGALRTLLARAQQAGCIRRDIDVDDLLALVAGAFAALRHADAETTPSRAARLTAVLFDGLRVTH
jgi:AcrR family transcriptional regulator